jgi:hypothetical protein
MKRGRNGKAVISCIATIHGALRDCRVESEQPADLGFGAAAIALAPQLLMRPALVGGKPVEARVSIPINWANMSGMSAPVGASSRVYTQLPWTAAPTVDQVMAAYPEKARLSGLGGTVIMACRIGKEGGLSQCESVRELPAGHGFLRAARSLVGRFRTPVQSSDGESIVGSRVHLNVAFAPGSPDMPSGLVGRPRWVAVPEIRDLAAVVPETAKKAKVYKARVVMTCSVMADGKVDGCAVESEDPASLGYGAAALSLTNYFRLAVWTEEGLPTVGGRVRIPLRFDLDSIMNEAAAGTP